MYAHDFPTTAQNWIIIFSVYSLLLGQDLLRRKSKEPEKLYYLYIYILLSATRLYQWEAEVGVITKTSFKEFGKYSQKKNMAVRSSPG